MFKKILVAINEIESDRPVFDEALAIAQAQGSSLLLLHILPSDAQSQLFPPAVIGYGTPLLVETTIERFRQDWQALENEGLSMLQAIAAEAKATGVPCDFIQLAGSPAPMISDIAKNWAVDLVVLGRRGFSGLTEFLAGSVSNYTLHHAPCSVLVVQSQPEPAAETARATNVVQWPQNS